MKLAYGSVFIVPLLFLNKKALIDLMCFNVKSQLEQVFHLGGLACPGVMSCIWKPVGLVPLKLALLEMVIKQAVNQGILKMLFL